MLEVTTTSDFSLAAAGLDVQSLRLLADYDAKLATSAASKLPIILLDGAMRLEGCNLGNVQLLMADSKELRIVAQQGFAPDFLDTFSSVKSDSPCSCGRALQRMKPILIEDTETDQEYVPFRAAAKSAGYRSVHSTPLITSRGLTVGVLSIHFATPRRPSLPIIHATAILARHAADRIEQAFHHFSVDEERLLMARRHVLQARERIKRQKELIREYELKGRDTTMAISILTVFEEILASMQLHLAQLEFRWTQDKK